MLPMSFSSGHEYVGARLQFTSGQVRLLPPVSAPPGMVKAQYSVLSPGTEQRHLAYPPREAGYMTLGRKSNTEGWVMAPVPHGAAFEPTCNGAVVAPPGVSIQVAALARFQQMAFLGLNRLPRDTDLDAAVVIGTGPVALGCALELMRRGAAQTLVVTSRRYAAIAKLPGVKCVTETEVKGAKLVIDTTGKSEQAITLIASGGVLGLLGTPEKDERIPALTVHREGITVMGMHELTASTPQGYQEAYTTVTTWLSEQLMPNLMASWCRKVPGTLAPRVYELLGTPQRPDEPVILFTWAVS